MGPTSGGDGACGVAHHVAGLFGGGAGGSAGDLGEFQVALICLQDDELLAKNYYQLQEYTDLTEQQMRIIAAPSVGGRPDSITIAA